MKERI